MTVHLTVQMSGHGLNIYFSKYLFTSYFILAIWFKNIKMYNCNLAGNAIYVCYHISQPSDSVFRYIAA